MISGHHQFLVRFPVSPGGSLTGLAADSSAIYAVTLGWNPSGLLSHLDWKRRPNYRPNDRTDRRHGRQKPQARLRGETDRAIQLLDESEELPLVCSQVTNVIDSIQRYFLFGQPIGAIEWGCFDHSGWSEFQKHVYRAVSQIPHGETRTYGWVSRKTGKWAAGRAVGQALRNNPLPLLIPCHRVVSSASIGGFMGNDDPLALEISLKRHLISLEERYVNPIFSFIEGMGGPSLRPTLCPAEVFG